MVSGRVPYTAETLSLLTDISLQVVSLGLSIFRGFDMIDDSDGVIYIKNWSKYQSEDKLELRREKDRQRKQLQRQSERDKIAIPKIADMSLLRQEKTLKKRQQTLMSACCCPEPRSQKSLVVSSKTLFEDMARKNLLLLPMLPPKHGVKSPLKSLIRSGI